MKPRDITRRILSRPLSSPFAPRTFRPRVGWLLLALLAWGLWTAFFSDRSLFRIAQLRREIRAADRELARVEDEQRTLERSTNGARARALHAERLLREQYGMARPGEIVYRFRDDPVAPDSTRR